VTTALLGFALAPALVILGFGLRLATESRRFA